MPVAAIISYRLGGTDGVSVEAAKWAGALRKLDYEVVTVAGGGEADVLIPGLAIDATEASEGELANRVDSTLSGADLVVAENICSLPLNPVAQRAVADCLRGRPALLHHHDLAIQRPHLVHHGLPPDDPAWRHVTINAHSRAALQSAGIASTLIHNRFDPDPPVGLRILLREALGVSPDTFLLLQPTRAIPRKDVPGAIRLAEGVASASPDQPVTYWLLGPPEDGYGPDLERVLAGATVPVLRGYPSGNWDIHDAYAACDAVVLPSTWEGFGNPAIESATHAKPLAIGPYPVASELARYGFTWFPTSDPDPLADFLAQPEQSLLDRNREVARHHFSLADLPAALAALGLGGANRRALSPPSRHPAGSGPTSITGAGHPSALFRQLDLDPVFLPCRTLHRLDGSRQSGGGGNVGGGKSYEG